LATDKQPAVDVRAIFALFLIHFIGDFYNSFVIPLLPLFADKFSLTLAQVGLVTGASRFLAFVVQPPVGYLADRYRRRVFALGGPLLVIVFISLCGVAPSYGVLMLFVCLGSTGSSMFHPTAAGMVEEHAGRHFGFSMAIFGMGGTLAFSLGPLFISWLVASWGLEATPLAMVLGLGIMVYLYHSVPERVGEKISSQGLLNTVRAVFKPMWKPLLMIWMIMTMRAYVSQSFLTFLPVLYARKGFSLLSLGMMVSVFTAAGAAAGLLAGYVADRIGFKPVFFLAHLLAAPSMALLLYAAGMWVYLGVFLAGFFLLATIPLGVALAQRLAPRGKSMAASLIMGLAYGIGGLLTPVTGKLADWFAIEPVLAGLTVIPLLTLILIAYLPVVGIAEARSLVKTDSAANG